MWSPVEPHVQWNLSNVVTCGTSCTVGPDNVVTYGMSFVGWSGYNNTTVPRFEVHKNTYVRMVLDTHWDDYPREVAAQQI